MTCTLTRREELCPSVWSGGSTTQLFLHPPGSDYAARDFELRISSARVEEDPSLFTHLPGYHRLLMPLDRPIRLVYEGRGEVELQPFQVEEFEGAWRTASHGSCTDLGVMLSPGWKGSMEAVGSGEYPLDSRFIGLYALDSLEVSAGEFSAALSKGDFLLMEAESGGFSRLSVKSAAPNAAALVRISRESSR